MTAIALGYLTAIVVVYLTILGACPGCLAANLTDSVADLRDTLEDEDTGGGALLILYKVISPIIFIFVIFVLLLYIVIMIFR